MNKQVIIRNIITYVVACLLAAGIIALYFSFRDYEAATDLEKIRMWCDAFTIPAILYLFVGGLVWSAQKGSMDGISYALTRLFRSLIPGGRSREDCTYYDYVEERRERHMAFRKYVFLFVVGGICLIAAIVLMIVFIQMETV